MKRAVLAVLLLTVAAARGAGDTGSAVTTTDPGLPVSELELLLKPLPRERLLAEADAWQGLLEAKAREIAALEILIQRENAELDRVKAAQDEVDKAATALEKAQSEVDRDGGESDNGAAETARKRVAEAEAALAEAVEALSRPALPAPAESDAASGQLSEREREELVAATAEAVEQQVEALKADKRSLLERVTDLREQRVALVDRLDAVLDELERKTDDADTETQARITDYRLYAKAVSGVKVAVDDTTSAWIVLRAWLFSPEGGKRWAWNLASFLLILAVAWMIARLISGAIRHALERSRRTSRLLEEFLVKAVRWLVLMIGLIMALSALEVSIGPLLALVGAAGFVIAFALQDSLSNFASGLMILFFRPFDQGDIVDAGGVSGKVESMNLVSTTILTFDNKRMVVPNNKIWSDVITNATGVSQRRVDLEFGIGYGDDIDRAQAILEEVVSSHPRVLKYPEPLIRVHALADSSVNFIVRPWAATADYWDVYWDLTRAVKQRFDAEGIGIPFPQRDVHLYLAGDGERMAASLRQGATTPAAARAAREPMGSSDGGTG